MPLRGKFTLIDESTHRNDRDVCPYRWNGLAKFGWRAEVH